MENIEIRECTAIDELDHCIRLQREVFGLPDLEVSPRRHLIVSAKLAAGRCAFARQGDARRLMGCVTTLAGVRNGNEIFGYSHMMAVDGEYQNQGVGARLKWSQRERAIREGKRFIKWTWDPLQARNAYFNLNRLGVMVTSYAENFYGTDYPTNPALNSAETAGSGPGIDSDRLFADWHLESDRVMRLAPGAGGNAAAAGSGPANQIQSDLQPAATIDIPTDWAKLCQENPVQAHQEQLRVRREFQNAFAAGLVAAGFERSVEQPRYLLYTEEALRSV